MKERGRYQIQFMKTRSSSGVGQKVDLEFNVDSLRINDLGEEESEGSFNQQRTSGTANIINQFKKTSTVTDGAETDRSEDPAEGIPVSKVRGSAGSSKIREMLANLNSEKD
jgi:hypothetical protein